MRDTTSKGRFRRALLLMKLAHTGHHPGAVPGFRPSPGNSEETTTRVLTEEISVLFRVPTWDPTHPGSPVSRALPGNTPTQGPTREGKPGFFLGGGWNPGRNPGHGLGKTRERGGFRVFPGWYCWGLSLLEAGSSQIHTADLFAPVYSLLSPGLPDGPRTGRLFSNYLSFHRCFGSWLRKV